MKLRAMFVAIITCSILSGCASTPDYPKVPPPCDSQMFSFGQSNHPCGPRRPVNRY